MDIFWFLSSSRTSQAVSMPVVTAEWCRKIDPQLPSEVWNDSQSAFSHPYCHDNIFPIMWHLWLYGEGHCGVHSWGAWVIGLCMVGKWLVSGYHRKLWSSPCFQRPDRCTWRALLTCSFSGTGSYMGHITPLWVHKLLPWPQGEQRQEQDSCAGCWGLMAVRNLLCSWMPKARSRESSACGTTETIKFVENKDPERARNWCWEREWTETVGNSGCIWTGVLRCVPGSGHRDIRQEPAGRHYRSPFVVGFSLHWSRGSRVLSTYPGGDTSNVHVGPGTGVCSKTA